MLGIYLDPAGDLECRTGSFANLYVRRLMMELRRTLGSAGMACDYSACLRKKSTVTIADSNTCTREGYQEYTTMSAIFRDF